MTNGPCLEATPVDPEKNGLSLGSSLGFGPDVECQTILALLIAGLVNLSKQADTNGTRQPCRISRTGWQISRAVPVNCQSAMKPRSPEAA